MSAVLDHIVVSPIAEAELNLHMRDGTFASSIARLIPRDQLESIELQAALDGLSFGVQHTVWRGREAVWVPWPDVKRWVGDESIFLRH